MEAVPIPCGLGPPVGYEPSAVVADGWGEQLAGGLCLDEAVLQELPELQVLATQDLALVAEALDQRPGGMTTGFGERLPMDAVDEPVGAGDDEGAAGPFILSIAFCSGRPLISASSTL